MGETMDEPYRNTLLATLQTDLRRSLNSLSHARPQERMIGYALCTDDGATTVSHVALFERDTLESKRNVRFNPNDWKSTENESDLDASYELLSQHARHARTTGSFAAHVEDSYAVLVESLLDLRRAGLIAPDCLLLVFSSDPGPRMLAREKEAVPILNSAEIAAAYLQATSA